MYIWNKSGTKLVKTENIVEIELVDETKNMRENHPATNGEFWVIRAYFKLGSKDKSRILAAYDNEYEAKSKFYQMINALGNDIRVFSFCEITENVEEVKDPYEEVLEQ